jgi:RNA polymerase sigma-70 factor (ECF subfamily)
LADLIQECLSGTNQRAWNEFVNRFRRLIAGTILKTARRFENPSPETVDDLIQDTYLRICSDNFRARRTFRSSVPEAIYGLVQSIAYSVVQDHRRSAGASKRGGSAPTVPVDILPGRDIGDQGTAQKLEREILIQEIEGLLEAAFANPEGERDRRVFWLYYRHGLTAKAIAALPSVDLSAKGVESLIFRVTAEVRRRMVDRKTAPTLAAGQPSGSGVPPTGSLRGGRSLQPGERENPQKE